MSYSLEEFNPKIEKFHSYALRFAVSKVNLPPAFQKFQKFQKRGDMGKIK
jgi:hypothetical protein